MKNIDKKLFDKVNSIMKEDPLFLIKILLYKKQIIERKNKSV